MNEITAKTKLFGRRKIFVPYEDITAENVVDCVNQCLTLHNLNCLEEEYLYWYRRGLQPILNRTKTVRPEICNKIVVNNANQVVVFKNGYFLTQPAFYVSRKNEADITEKVQKLNEYLYISGKQQADNEIVNWFHTVGVGVLYVEPNKDKTSSTPYHAYSLDPRSSFVAYSRRPGNPPKMGVNMVTSDKDTITIDVFTEDRYFRLSGGIAQKTVYNTPAFGIAQNIEDSEPNYISAIPIIEYTFDENRMGAFESAIPLMDCINIVESNRADGIEQFIQSLCVAVNCEFEQGTTANEIREAGMISLKTSGENKADFKILSEALDQAQTQITLDNLYAQVLAKCGVPSTEKPNGSTSDNVGAVYLRDGFAIADTHARNTEDLFKISNRLFDEVVLKILKKRGDIELEIEDFKLQFVRSEMNNLLVKTQAALNLKQLGLSPEITLAKSGVSNDPMQDVANSKKYIDSMWGANDNAQTDIVDETRTEDYTI